MLRELRELGLLTFQTHRVTTHDRSKLETLAGYEDIETLGSDLSGDQTLS